MATIDELYKQGQGIQEGINQAKKSLGGLTTPNVDTGVITSEDLQSNTGTNFESPKESSIFDITKLNNYITPALEETPSESKAQSLTDQLQVLNQSLVGESAYRGEQEASQDIVGLTKTKTDLSNQLKILQNEALAIPMQMQQEAQGRGITAGGLKPLETAKLRENSIKALTTSALLEAANSNLATANDLVDRAVAAKYDPVREQITTATNNLNLILQSPDYTREEKNRAQAQLDIQNAKKAALDEEEANQKEIWDIATTAAKNGADNLTLQKIQQAKTKEEALKISTESGVAMSPADKLDLQLKQLQVEKAKQELSADESNELLTIKEAQDAGVPYGTTKGQLITTGGGAVAKKNEEKMATLKDKISSIDTLLTHRGLQGSVGPNALARASVDWNFFTGVRQDFVAGVEQLTNKETLDSLLALKQAGGTLGALNESEGEMLRNAATKINNWAKKDKNGKVIGYNISESAFRAELNTIKKLADRALTNAGGNIEENYLDDVDKLLIETNNPYSQAGYIQ